MLALLDEIHALAAPRVRPERPGGQSPWAPAGAHLAVVAPSLGRERDYRLRRLAWKLAFGELANKAQEAAMRRELRKAIGRSRMPVARLCRALLRRDVLPPVKARMSAYTDALDLPGYHARREFLWTFLREEARAALGTRRLSSIPHRGLLAVAEALYQAYPWLPPAGPPLPVAGPPPHLTAEQIAAGLPTGLDYPDPAAADTARRFGFPSPDALRMSRSRRYRGSMAPHAPPPHGIR